MSRVEHWLSLCVIVCGLALIPAGAYGLPFTNGSFEAGTNPGGGFITLGAGSTVITGWTVTAPIDYIGGLWQAADGSRSLDLNATAAGGIQQMFDTTPGTQYEVKFDLAGNPAGGPPSKQMQVAAAGNFMVESFNTTGRSSTNMGWSERTFLFIAAAPTTTLQFTSLLGTAFGPALDNVRVTAVTATPVPEPNTTLLLGMGLVSLLGYGWRQKVHSAREEGSQVG